MSEKEVIEQLESLIEAWYLKEADLNQTDINAIRSLLQENQQLKEKLKQKVSCPIISLEDILYEM